MEIDTRCPVCSRLDEDGGHCFLKRKFVKECWRGVQLEDVRINLCELPSAKEVAASILALHEDKKLLIICLLWSWWYARNEANVGENSPSPDEVIYRARGALIITENDAGAVARNGR